MMIYPQPHPFSECGCVSFGRARKAETLGEAWAEAKTNTSTKNGDYNTVIAI